MKNHQVLGGTVTLRARRRQVRSCVGGVGGTGSQGKWREVRETRVSEAEREGFEHTAKSLGTARFITPRDAKYDAQRAFHLTFRK